MIGTRHQNQRYRRQSTMRQLPYNSDGHCCLRCHGDCHHCIGLIIIVVLHLHCRHHTPSPQCDSPPPIGPVAVRCGHGRIHPQRPHQKGHPRQGNDGACTCRLQRPTPADWRWSRLGDEQHCHCGRHFLPLPSCLTLSTPPPIFTVLSTTCSALLLTVILFFPGSPPEGYLPVNPPNFFYLCEGHIIYHEKPQRPNFLLMKKIVVMSIVSWDY
jgi:hypothetical protein